MTVSRDCPWDSFRNLTHIIWGNGGGYLKQGSCVDVGNINNKRILNALTSAAIQGTAETMENFGSGTPGRLEAVLT